MLCAKEMQYTYCSAIFISTKLLSMLQFNVSSQAKNGGAYFLAVRGSVIDPIAVPGQFEVTRV